MENKNFLNQQLPNYLNLLLGVEELKRNVYIELENFLKENYTGLSSLESKPWFTEEIHTAGLSVYSNVDKKIHSPLSWIGASVRWNGSYNDGAPYGVIDFGFTDKNKALAFIKIQNKENFQCKYHQDENGFMFCIEDFSIDEIIGDSPLDSVFKQIAYLDRLLKIGLAKLK